MVWLVKLTSSVCPSGAAFATVSAARLPPAPGLFSTITGCPSAAASSLAIARAIVSVVPPADAPTRMRTGRDGYSDVWAWPAPGQPAHAAAMRTADTARENARIISDFLVFCGELRRSACYCHIVICLYHKASMDG